MKGNVKRILSFCLTAVIAVTTVGYATPSFALTEMTTKLRMEEAIKALASPSEAESPGDKATPSEAENPGDKATPSEAVKFVQGEPEEIPEYYTQVKKAGKKFWKFEDRYGEMQYRDYGYVEGEAEFPLWYEVDNKSEIELSISVDLVDEYYNLAPYIYDSISPTKSNWSDLSSRLLLDNESIFLYERQEIKGFTNWDFSTYSIWSVNGILKKDLEERDLNEDLGYFFYGSISNVRDSVEQWYYADNEGCINDMSPTIDPKVSLFAANQVEVIYNLCTSDDPTNGPDNIKYTDWVDVSDGDEYYTLKDYTLEGQRLLGYMRGTSYYDLDISSTTRGNKTIRFSPQNYNYPYHVNYNVFYPSGTKIKKKDLTTQVFYAIWVPDNYDVLVALYEEDFNFPYSGINSDPYLRFVNDRFKDRPYGYPIKGPFGYWRMKRIMVKKKGVSYNLDLIPRNGITLEGTTYWKYSPLEHGNNFNATFDGWVTEDGEKLSTWVPDGSGRVTYIFPKWNLQNHLVTFKGIDGVIETQQVPFGNSATEPKNITTPNGFKFIGWDTDFSDIRKDIVVNAKYEEKKTVSVTYKDWDGKVLSYQELALGENAAPPETPARSGYTFTGWDKPSTNIQADTTITAQYNKVNRYELTLDANGGTIGGESKRTENVIYGESFDQILKDGRDQVSNEYYTFAGWYTSPSEGSKYDYSENRMPESDLTVYAHWTRSSSLVTFYDWEGNVIGTQVVGVGESATLPAAPARPGYTFVGWDTDTTSIGDHTVVKPIYKINSYQLTLDANGGTIRGESKQTETVTYGDSFDQILKDGKDQASDEYYTFAGWYTSPLGGSKYDYSGNRMPASELTVYAHWTRSSSLVTFYDWEGNIIGTQVVGIGGSATLPAAPVRPGYTFMGWDTDTTSIEDHTVVKPIYKINSYELIMDANGGTMAGESKQTETVTYGDSFDQILKDGRDQASNEYYTFAGWYTFPSGGSKYDYSGNRMPSSELTVYAHWTRSSSLVTFYDWEGNIIGTQVVGIGGSVTLPAASVRPGYTFIGWDTDTTSIGDHTVVKPIYKINSYVLTLDANGGALNGKSVEEKNFVYGDSFDQSLSDGRDNATRKYHTFDGWYTKPTGGEKYTYTGNKMPAGDVTAYAHWSRNASLVTYKDLDGRVLGNQEVIIGGDATPPADPERQGYTFTGWDKPSTNIMDDTTIVAQYNKNNYKLILEGNGGSLDGSNAEEEYTITYGASFDQILLEGKNNVSRPGYTFDGWYSAETRGNCYSYSGNVMPSNDLKVYAQWKANSYTVHFDSDHEIWPGGVIERKYIAGTELGSLPAPNIYGWELLGWWTGKNGTGEKVTEDTVTGTQDLTYYGSWKASSYQIRYLSEVKQPTGKSIQEFPITQTYDTALGDLPTPVETGYTFLGWFYGTEKVISETIFSPASGAEGYTYCAGWKANEYTVHYDGNLVAVKKNAEDKLLTYGEIIGELPVINAEGYIFLGWYTEPTGGTKVIEETPILGNTTYYAQWDTISKPTVPDPIKPEPENRVEDEKITVPITPIIDSTAKPTVPDTGGTFAANPDNPYDVTYTKPDGTTARDEWVGDGKDWYHVDKSGKLNYDWYLEREKTWYKLNKEPGDKFGAALTGWNYEPMDDKSYFFDPSTTKMLTGWQLIDSKWYYFTKQNESQTYYGSNPNGWKYDETKPGKPYGSMYQDEMTPDGYRVDENGVWKNK